MAKTPVIYILASQRNGTLYIGVTSNLQRRVSEHKGDLVDGFTKKYGVHRLVYYEIHQDMASAITREKQMKKMELSMEVGVDRKTKPRVERFMERYHLAARQVATGFPLSR
jgi:putative endonuclease